MERDVLLNSVALVENSKHRDPLRHGGDSGLGTMSGGSRGDRAGGVLLPLPAAARRERQREQDGRGGSFHAYSGIHGS
jgi:hypothetical protein